MPLVTASDYKTSRSIAGTGLDSVITQAIASAQAYAERWCRGGGSFDSGTKTEWYDGTNTDTLTLMSYPVASITSVSLYDEDGNETLYDTNSSPTLAATFNFDADDDNKGRLWYRGSSVSQLIPVSYGAGLGRPIGYTARFPRGRRNVKVIYSGGYSTVPDDLVETLYYMVDIIMAKRGGDPTLQSETLGSYSWTSAANMDQKAAVFSRLEPFRIRWYQ